jgi:hypothetical protein
MKIIPLNKKWSKNHKSPMHYLGDFITKKCIGRHVRYTSIYDGKIYLTYFFWNILDIFYHKRASTWFCKRCKKRLADVNNGWSLIYLTFHSCMAFFSWNIIGTEFQHLKIIVKLCIIHIWIDKIDWCLTPTFAVSIFGWNNADNYW